MTNGQITDTVLNAAEQAVSATRRRRLHQPDVRAVPAAVVPDPVVVGLATVAMPIMAPLASFANVPPELVVTAYQTGNGLVNLVTPTSAVVMGGLAIAAWATARGSSSCGPLLVILAILCMAVMSVAVVLG